MHPGNLSSKEERPLQVKNMSYTDLRSKRALAAYQVAYIAHKFLVDIEGLEETETDDGAATAREAVVGALKRCAEMAAPVTGGDAPAGKQTPPALSSAAALVGKAAPPLQLGPGPDQLTTRQLLYESPARFVCPEDFPEVSVWFETPNYDPDNGIREEAGAADGGPDAADGGPDAADGGPDAGGAGGPDRGKLLWALALAGLAAVNSLLGPPPRGSAA